MLSNSLRAINFNICNIREIQEVLNDVNEQLSDLMFSETFKDDDSKKYQIHKIKIFIQRNSIYSITLQLVSLKFFKCLFLQLGTSRTPSPTMAMVVHHNM